MTRAKQIPVESLVNLRLRLDALPARSQERSRLVQAAADLYGVSTDSLYRALRVVNRPQPVHRSDLGKPRKLSAALMERYLEVIAACKIRTLNKKGRHISTARAIELLEKHGLQTPDGFVQLPPGLLTRATVDRYLKAWGYDHPTLTRESPAVRFQAERSNDCWQFDLSPSDLKHLENPAWIEPGKGKPLLMLYSVVDDRSGACYQEYHSVYGEDTEAALRFLFNAMSVKKIAGFPLSGIPKMLYTDNGPVARSRIFLNVMECLGVSVTTHQPRGRAIGITAARAKGKVERPFRTVKEAHETLYHFHQPETEDEANRWLHNYLVNYNNQPHRTTSHSRFDDWRENQPSEGIREMCSWERFCTFAREPERRKVDNTARVNIDGAAYEVDPELAGNTVILWWGLFDNQLFVEYNEQKYGPFYPVGGAVQLRAYRKFKRTKNQERIERVAALADQLGLPRRALEGNSDLEFLSDVTPAEDNRQLITIPFQDPDPFQEFAYPNALLAKRAIAEHLGQPLTRLLPEQRMFIDRLVSETLIKKILFERVKQYFQPARLTLPLEESVEEEEKYVN